MGCIDLGSFCFSFDFLFLPLLYKKEIERRERDENERFRIDRKNERRNVSNELAAVQRY